MPDTLQQYLEQMVSFRTLGHVPAMDGPYLCMEDFVLKRGTRFASAPLTEDELAIVRRAVGLFGKRCKPKECFANATQVVAYDFDHELDYTEGYALGMACIPVHHAWLTINGKVVDLTWPVEGLGDDDPEDWLQNRALGTLPDGWTYLGVRFKSNEIVARMMRTEWAASVLDDWRDDWPVLRGLHENWILGAPA